MHQPADVREPEAELRRAAVLLRAARQVAVLTGAGVSAESGVPTFRGGGGLWEGQRVEDVATPEAFRRDPALVWRFYNRRRAQLGTVRPNPGHHALAALEQRLGPDNVTLVTQNVDGLHELAGSRGIVELHGRIDRVRCTRCEARRPFPDDAPDAPPPCPECGAPLRPDVVCFGEMLPPGALEAAHAAASDCDVFLSVGTSNIVEPAASLPWLAARRGAPVVVVNLTSDGQRAGAGIIHLNGPAGAVLPALVERAWPDAPRGT